MSNINDLVLYELLLTPQTSNAFRTVGKGALKYGGLALGGTAALGAGTAAGVNALANSGVGKGLFTGALTGATAHYGGQLATQGASNLVQTALSHGINNSIASNAASWLPVVGNAVSAATSVGTQQAINSVNDEIDRVRGITPTSSWLGNTIKNGVAGLAGWFGGGFAPALQGWRLGRRLHELDELKKQRAYYNAGGNQFTPKQQTNMAPENLNGY